MKALGGCTRSRRFSRLVRRRWHRPRSLVLSMLLLGLSIGICNAQTTTPTSQPREHVYLLRGFANVFSLGMDQIAAKLKQHGIHTTVDNYLAWPTLAEQAAAEYKGGQTRTIVLVGHSSGATAVTEMAARLSQLGVPVTLPTDSAIQSTGAKDSVARCKMSISSTWLVSGISISIKTMCSRAWSSETSSLQSPPVPRAPLSCVTHIAAKAAVLPNTVPSLKARSGPRADNCRCKKGR